MLRMGARFALLLASDEALIIEADSEKLAKRLVVTLFSLTNV